MWGPHRLALQAAEAFRQHVVPQLQTQLGLTLVHAYESPQPDGRWHASKEAARHDIQSGIDYVFQTADGREVSVAARVQSDVFRDFADFGLKPVEIRKAVKRIEKGAPRPRLNLHVFLLKDRIVTYLCKSDALYGLAAKLPDTDLPDGRRRMSPDGLGGTLKQIYVDELPGVVRIETSRIDKS